MPAAGNASGTFSGSADASGPIDLANHKFPVSWQDALKTAQGKFNGDVSKIELLSDKQKYAVQVDAKTGKVTQQG